MSNIVTSSKSETSVYELFKNMNLSVAVDSDTLAMSWLEKHGKDFIGFVNGCWLQPEKDAKMQTNCYNICDKFNGKHLCNIHVPVDDSLILRVAENSSSGFKTWSTMSPISRSRILYKIAQTLEKYQLLFATVEAVSSGKHISRVKTKEVPDLIESFNYYASLAAQFEKAWFPIGPVCVVAEEYNNPSLALSLKVSCILATGCSVLLLTDIRSSLSSFLLAEICSESGLPAGVLNVIPIDQEKIDSISISPIFSKLVFTGSSEKSVLFSKLAANSHIPCDILIPRRPVFIVYEDADLYSAADGALETFFIHDARNKSGGCKLMIQESVYEDFLQILSERFSNVIIGHNLSKTDMSSIVTEKQKKILTEWLEEAVKLKAKIVHVSKVDDNTLNYPHMMPVLISDLPTNFKLVNEELGGPIIVVVPFRTVKESLSMFNCDNKGSPVSIWTEKISVTLEIALNLKTSVVWVNSENKNDARFPYSSIYFSGNSVDGGKEALYHHMSVTTVSEQNILDKTMNGYLRDAWLSSFLELETSTSSIMGINDNVKEYKLFIGGTFRHSENGSVKCNENTFAPSATASDVKNAVSSAVAAQPKWESLSYLQKKKCFLAVISNLKKAKEVYVSELHKVSKIPVNECQEEFDQALDLLYYLATQEDKFCGPVQEIKKNLLVLQNRKPLGVIGIQCPDEKPLLSSILLIFSAVACGNAVVALSSTLYPTIALKICEIFSSANIPGGVINIVSGDNKHLIPALCKNTDINAIWFNDISHKIVYDNTNVSQRVFYCGQIWVDFNETKSLKCAVECTYIKTIFLPAGGMFAN